jgi:hypothetical protein
MSHDGFVDAKSWTSQILRVVAAFQGGVDLQSAAECVAGMQYSIGEATRIISEHEDFFASGQRADHLVASSEIGYPNLLVLKKGDARLVLLFNEGAEPLAVSLENKDVRPGQKARVYGSAAAFADPRKMRLELPRDSVTVVVID